uniref:Rho GTPase-activating protein 30 isoform X1 n=1 Tax=Pogona vitticeps TaxID=103695 RepID=A0A6J0UZ20_9SAUR
MSLAMKARQRVKKKGASKDRIFGCDLVEHLQLSGQEVPQVLKSCTEFVEHHGIVDGIYRLSGVSSNIQKLRLEFDTDRTPDLNKDVYLQDIHCVSSLCKAYFRELPNPLLTYQLYDKFAEAVAIQMEEGRLEKIKEVLKELPSPHYRTLEFLMKHLVHMASFSSQTNMHVRNLAIVWAPNLLRSKDIEASGFNGTAAFMEVRIQSIVVEFILTHVDQIFGDAPLRVGSRESLRKSLLLMAAPVPLSEDKYSFPYNVPAVLNQGDGPPQMRPYHTIIELTDSKRKGSLKGKRWKSIFNLGRYSQDSKRKMNKPEDKAAKMRLRPAKSMDSLSSVPCASNDDAQLGRNKSQKQLTLYQDSLDGPASLDPSFLEPGEVPEKFKEPPGGESEGEATAKSEPTTPKASRSSLVGASPQGRSPKAARNRAEKCAGVHISGPFSVMVPFHITSNLTLSRLTRGQECPALSHGAPEKEPVDSSVAKEGEEQEEKERGHEASTGKEEPAGTDTKEGGLNDSEVNRMSMEVQDSFSFLDSQDAWLGDSLQEDQNPSSFNMAPAFAGGDLDDPSTMEDDMGSGFLNEMMGSEVQLAMFSSLPPLDYLSIEECMDEHLGEEEEYYLATDCIHSEDLPKEGDSEEVYLSAFDDLSPLANEPEPLQPSDELRGSEADFPQAPLEDQPFSLVGGTPFEDPARSHLSEAEREPQVGVSPAHGPGFTDAHPEPEMNPSEETAANPRSDFGDWETQQKDEAETAMVEAAEVGSPLTSWEEGAVSGPNGKDLLLRTGDSQKMKPADAVNQKNLQRSLAEAHEDRTAPSSPDDEWNWPLETHTVFQDELPPCPPGATGVKAGGSVPSGASDGPVECGLPSQEAGLCPETARDLSSEEDTSSLGTRQTSLLGSFPEKESSGRSPVLTSGQPGEGSQQAASPEPEFPGVSDSEGCLDVCSSKSWPGDLLQNPPQAPPGEAKAAFRQDLSDGSVSMKLTSSTIRVQQVRSFPVVPPKPQFAKIPPALKPKLPAKEASLAGPTLPVCGNGMRDSVGEGSYHRPLRPTSLDTSRGNTESRKNTESFSTFPTSPRFLDGTSSSDSGARQKQRNSMPGSLEKYSRDGKGGEDTTPKLLSSPLDEAGLWPKRGQTDREYPNPMKSSPVKSQETGKPKNGDGKGEPSRRLCPAPSEGHGASPQKPRWNNWRHGGSMSFDEAVSLAKERQLAQAPVRRMQTYCFGDAEGPPGLLRMEEPAPQAKLALKPLGEGMRRAPASGCVGVTAASEAPASRKALPTQALPNVGLEGGLPPSQEALFPPQDLQPSRRLSLSKIGRCLSVSEETSYTMPQEWR